MWRKRASHVEIYKEKGCTVVFFVQFVLLWLRFLLLLAFRVQRLQYTNSLFVSVFNSFKYHFKKPPPPPLADTHTPNIYGAPPPSPPKLPVYINQVINGSTDPSDPSWYIQLKYQQISTHTSYQAILNNKMKLWSHKCLLLYHSDKPYC